MGMNRGGKLFEAKEVLLGLGWYALTIALLFGLGFFLSWVVSQWNA